MDECLFCDIVNNIIPCEKLIENDSIIAFRDINPQAPTPVSYTHLTLPTNREV